MSDLVLVLVADYDLPILFCVTFLSCLALPVPSSLLMLASGGFAQTGDLSLFAVMLAAFSGAVLGDNSGYWLARGMGSRLTAWLAARPKRAAMHHRGQAFMNRWGGASVFFFCWLVAPLGPYINYVSGLTQFSWMRFAMWGVLGEIVWVTLYVGLGYTFADRISALASLMGNLSGLTLALAAVIGLGLWLWRARRKMAVTA